MMEPARVVRRMGDVDRGIWAEAPVGSVPELVEQSVYLRASARRLGLLDEHGGVSLTGLAVQQHLRQPSTPLRRKALLMLGAYLVLCMLFGIAYLIQSEP